MAGLYEGPENPEDIEKVLEELGGEKAIAAQRVFRRRIREIMEVFRNSFLENTRVGPTERRRLVRVAGNELEDAAIEFQAVMSEFNQKV